MEVVAFAVAAAGGAGVGLSLPMLVFRLSVPSGNAVASRCPGCRAALPAGWRGWVGRGVCRRCRQPLSAGRWCYALAGAAVFGSLGWRFALSDAAELMRLAAWLVFAAAGIGLAAIDLYVQRLPSRVMGPAAGLAAALIAGAGLIAGQVRPAVTALLAATVVGLSYLVLALSGAGRMGLGDVRLASFAGLLLGSSGWGVVLLGTALSWLLAAGAALFLVVTDRSSRTALMPFGPYLVAGALLAAALSGAPSL